MPMKIVASGAWGLVAYAVLSGGACPAEDFMDGLLSDEKGKRYHATLMKHFQRMATQGRITNETQFKKLQGVRPTLVEFKAHQARVIGFFHGRGLVVLTHGFRKKQDRTPKQQIERAHDIRARFLRSEQA